MKPQAYKVVIARDDEAGVYYVADSNVPGLATEAPTLDALRAKLHVLIPELIEANDEVNPVRPRPAQQSARRSISVTARMHETLQAC